MSAKSTPVWKEIIVDMPVISPFTQSTRFMHKIIALRFIGIHASDLIHEASAAIRDRQTVQKLATIVHAHPTLSEVLDEAYKRAAHI